MFGISGGAQRRPLHAGVMRRFMIRQRAFEHFCAAQHIIVRVERHTIMANPFEPLQLINGMLYVLTGDDDTEDRNDIGWQQIEAA